MTSYFVTIYIYCFSFSIAIAFTNDSCSLSDRFFDFLTLPTTIRQQLNNAISENIKYKQ
ncbi:hypothetical protein [Hyella patelloides]|nr:hypothetical protein [Hyella patelloides]